MHVDWLDAYWSEDKDLKAARQFVDERKICSNISICDFTDVTTDRNCEDLLMQFFQTRHTRTAPLLVRAGFKDFGLGNGISSGASHLGQRTACLRKFFASLAMIPWYRLL